MSSKRRGKRSRQVSGSLSAENKKHKSIAEHFLKSNIDIIESQSDSEDILTDNSVDTPTASAGTKATDITVTEKDMSMNGPENVDINKKLDAILSTVESNTKSLKEMKISLDTVTATVSKVQEKLDGAIQSLTITQKDVDDLKQKGHQTDARLRLQSDKVEKAENEMVILKSRMDALQIQTNKMSTQLNKQEDYSSRNNLLFSGIPENKNENCLATIQNIL